MKKIIIFAPHADDEILGCGGFIAKYSNIYNFTVIVMTNANVGASELYSKKEMSTIRDEAIISNEYIGTKKLIFENFPGLNLNSIPYYKLSDTILKHILNIKPEIVLIPSSLDIHSDHKIIHDTAKVALRPNIKKNIVKKILSYEVLSETEWNEQNLRYNPNYYINLSNKDVCKKIAAFKKYKSQLRKFPHPRSAEGIMNLAKYRGSQINVRYAETYTVERILD